MMKSNVKSKLWIAGFLLLALGALATVILCVVKVDPFFHYHQPDTEHYFYTLNNERSQNDGILKHFAYDAIITGTSMTENFRATEMDALFGTDSIKVPFSGGTYKEINDSVCRGLSANENIRIVVRGLDLYKLTENKDTMREDLGEYPTYLYDDNVLNDIEYVLNRDVIFSRVYPMHKAGRDETAEQGITSFDDYKNWMQSYSFGRNTVCADVVFTNNVGEPVHLTDEERGIVQETIIQNVTSVAEQYPDVTFYYFLTPYSAVYWQEKVQGGTIYRQVEAEEIAITEMLQYDNIKLYSFNLLTDITTDLNNYKDTTHYGEWVNSLMLQYMHDGKCLLTYENYEKYLEDELAFYLSFDYTQLNEQKDWENDYYAAALVNETVNGVEPLYFSEDMLRQGALQQATIVTEDGTAAIRCSGALRRESGSEVPVCDYLMDSEYAGIKIEIDDISDYKYLVFYGTKIQSCGQPSVYVYDGSGEMTASFTASYSDLDNEQHQYLIDVSSLTGPAMIIFNGGYVDNTGSEDSLYTFSDITLY